MSTALLRDRDAFQHFATIARVIPHVPSSSAVDELQDAVLVRNVFPCESLVHWDALRSALAQWRLDVETSSGYAFHDDVRVSRHAQGSDWHHDPCFFLEAREDVGNAPEPRRQPPYQAYLSSNSGLFAESFAALAAEFLRAPQVARWNAFALSYRLVLPDHTGVIKHIERNDRSVLLEVHQGDPSFDLIAAAVGTAFDNHRMRVTAPVVDGRAEVLFPRSAKIVDVWLLLSSGEWLDRYQELSAPVGWLDAFPGGVRSGAISDDLFAEIDAGESETLEFKPWLDVRPSDSKRRELLEVACSFANSAGGSILLGVSDSAVLLPFSKARKGLGHASGTYENAMDAYATQIRRFLTEAIRPRASVDLQWHDHAGQNILRVRVTAGQEATYSVADNGDIYVRRGATSRKVRQDEAPALVPRAPGSV